MKRKQWCSVLLLLAMSVGTVPALAVDALQGEEFTAEEQIQDPVVAEQDEEMVEQPAEEITIPSEQSVDTEETGQEETVEQAGEDETAPAQVEVVDQLSEVSELISENWDDSYYGEITIDPSSDEVEKDGADISLQSEMNLTRAEEQSVLHSTEAAAQFFEDQPEYEMYADREGVIHLNDRFQTCRLIVHAGSLDGEYDAERILLIEENEQYILQFDTPEQTYLAYEQLEQQYGDNCQPDMVYSQDMLMDAVDSKSATAPKSWGASYMGLKTLKNNANAYGLGSKSVTVAVIDSGIDKGHSFFSGRTLTGYNFVDDDRDGTIDTTDYSDRSGHGTHVAGIIADCTPDNVSIMALRVFDASGNSTLLSIDLALQYAQQQGADIVNFSLGAVVDPGVKLTVWDKSIERLYDSGVPVVAAAGNLDVTNPKKWVTYPATLDTTYAISAIDQDGVIASYSCVGSAVDYAAPGTDIVSAKVGGGTLTESGTSMAAPHMSAAMAMILLKHPTYSLSKIDSVLEKYTVDLGKTGKDTSYGKGVVKMGKYYVDDTPDKNWKLISNKSMTVKYSKKSYTGKARTNTVTIQLNGKTLSSKYYKLTYSNNTKIGKATVKATAIAPYSGSMSATFQVVPTTPTWKSAKNLKGKKLSLKWNRRKSGNGYQIKYATKSSFSNAKTVWISKNSTTSKTISGLKKGKTYYVHVRAYKTVNGTRYYGRWSTTKKIKITK